jgi:hypothetical protein
LNGLKSKKIKGTLMRKIVIAVVLLTSTLSFAQSRRDDGRRDHNRGVRVRRTFTCESIDKRLARCSPGLNVLTRGIILGTQLSKKACIENSTFSIDRRYDLVTVTDGCRATFIAEGFTDLPLAGDIVLDRPDEYVALQITCSSQDNHVTTCPTDMREIRRAFVLRQLSKSSCLEGRDFEIVGGSLTVRNGCRAIFQVEGVR